MKDSNFARGCRCGRPLVHGYVRGCGAGTGLPVVDALLAATAFEHNLAIVTRNVSDFVRPGLQIVDPWTA